MPFVSQSHYRSHVTNGEIINICLKNFQSTFFLFPFHNVILYNWFLIAFISFKDKETLLNLCYLYEEPIIYISYLTFKKHGYKIAHGHIQKKGID